MGPDVMKTIGKRIQPELQAVPSGDLLKRAASINEALSALLPGGRTCVLKGVYRYRTLADANRHLDEMTAAAMASGDAAHA